MKKKSQENLTKIWELERELASLAETISLSNPRVFIMYTNIEARRMEILEELQELKDEG